MQYAIEIQALIYSEWKRGQRDNDKNEVIIRRTCKLITLKVNESTVNVHAFTPLIFTHDKLSSREVLKNSYWKIL